MSDCTWVDAPPPVDLGGHVGGSTHCLGPPSGRATDLPGYGEAVAQAFLAEFAPGFTLEVHFHRVDQFQWFVRGGARFASHEVGAEIMHMAENGLSRDGDPTMLLETGATEIGGSMPINTDGGLIANGEPIGASGRRQVFELVHQLRGTAGRRQVPNHPKVGYAQLYGAPGVSGVSILTR